MLDSKIQKHQILWILWIQIPKIPYFINIIKQRSINYRIKVFKVLQYFEYKDSTLEYVKVAIARTLYRSFDARRIETNQIWPFQFERLSRQSDCDTRIALRIVLRHYLPCSLSLRVETMRSRKLSFPTIKNTGNRCLSVRIS